MGLQLGLMKSNAKQGKVRLVGKKRLLEIAVAVPIKCGGRERVREMRSDHKQ